MASKSMLQTTFTEDDLGALKDHLERYKNTASLHGPEKKEARKAVLTAVQEALKRSRPGLKKPEWEALKAVSIFQLP